MAGLFRRNRRTGAADQTRTEPTASPTSERSPLPAGVDAADLENRPTTRSRGRLRRRVRFLRRARELMLRDLGGLVYEIRRREHDAPALLDDRVRRLTAVDAELRELEAELGLPRGETVLRVPGVGGTCPECGELRPSDAKFCSACGHAFDAAKPAAAVPAAAVPAAAVPAAAVPAADVPAADVPAADVPAADVPADKPAPDVPADLPAEKPAGAEQPGSEQPTVEEPAANAAAAPGEPTADGGEPGAGGAGNGKVAAPSTTERAG